MSKLDNCHSTWKQIVTHSDTFLSDITCFPSSMKSLFVSLTQARYNASGHNLFENVLVLNTFGVLRKNNEVQEQNYHRELTSEPRNEYSTRHRAENIYPENSMFRVGDVRGGLATWSR